MMMMMMISSVISHHSSIINHQSIINQRSIRHHLDVIWGSFGGHIGIIWDHLGIIWGSFGDHLGIVWVKKTKMVDATGRNRSKFGNFDTDRCASISGPRKSRFWPVFPNFFHENLDFSVWGLALESLITEGFGCFQKVSLANSSILKNVPLSQPLRRNG